MVSAPNTNLLSVDWSLTPAPVDDGAADRLAGAAIPEVALPATDGRRVALARLVGRTIVFTYPRTGVLGETSIVDDWDLIPGARGCTPQSCAFRNLHADLCAAGASAVCGLSVQDTGHLRAVADRLHLPFPLLSDETLLLARAMNLPLLLAGPSILLKRLALIIDDGLITKVFYPVFPPDRNAADVLAWLRTAVR